MSCGPLNDKYIPPPFFISLSFLKLLCSSVPSSFVYILVFPICTSLSLCFCLFCFLYFVLVSFYNSVFLYPRLSLLVSSVQEAGPGHVFHREYRELLQLAFRYSLSNYSPSLSFSSYFSTQVATWVL